MKKILSLLLVGLMGCNAPEVAPEVLSFSAIPDQNSTQLKAKFDRLAHHLGAELGVDVRYVPATDYTASVEMFKSGDVQLAWFGGLTGVQARKAVAGARAIAQGVEDPNYKSYFIANSATGITKSDAFPEGIKSLRFTFGSQASTSGRLMPEHFIRENTGQGPMEWFEQTPGFSGAHDKTAQMVASGAVDAGVLSYKTYDKMVADGRIDAEQATIIWETPPYADYNFTAHPDLETKFGDGFTDKLAATLIAIKDPELLDAFPRSGIIAAKNSDFDSIVEVAQSLGMLGDK